MIWFLRIAFGGVLVTIAVGEVLVRMAVKHSKDKKA